VIVQFVSRRFESGCNAKRVHKKDEKTIKGKREKYKENIEEE
jgi:hypothetical protein